MSERRDLFATAPLGLEHSLAGELTALGAEEVKELRAGVSFRGDLATAYRACLWSRVASRVLLHLARIPAPDPDALYAGVRRLDWTAHLAPGRTIAVDFTSRGSPLRHTRFAAQRVKDGIVDQLRKETGTRPNVDPRRPDLRINVHAAGTWATVAVDLAGESLHRRGYRPADAPAPLKENLAAALLLLLGWPEIADRGGPLVDPLCGTGTLLVEGAWIAGDIAPGLRRERFGFEGWRGHDAEAWRILIEEAHARREAGLDRLPRIVGYDSDRGAVRSAHDAIAAADLVGRIHVERRTLERAEAPPTADGAGLVVANPPYGQRLGSPAAARRTYAELGRTLRDRFSGWTAGVLAGEASLGFALGLRASRKRTVYNGRIECLLLTIPVPEVGASAPPDRPEDEAPADPDAELSEPSTGAAVHPADASLAAFRGRLTKRVRHLGKWARRRGITCYRLYDSDIPEFALAIDRYEDRIHVQEYAAPDTVNPLRAGQRLSGALAVIEEVLDVPPARVFFKTRQRMQGGAQYDKLAEEGHFHSVGEGGHRFLINLEDYLDTGLFLDHRRTREQIGELARGRRFLNLFCYTATATVYAAKGGATRSTSVDLSQTYLDWARRNLRHNRVPDGPHELVRADCLRWLRQTNATFDLVFCDPPTFSRSKKMEGTFDVQRDHVDLVRSCVARLAPGGILLFSTNRRKFKLDSAALEDLQPREITADTRSEDFGRTPNIHRIWRIDRAS